MEYHKTNQIKILSYWNKLIVKFPPILKKNKLYVYNNILLVLIINKHINSL